MVEPICRCGVGQVLPATSILQERLKSSHRCPYYPPPTLWDMPTVPRMPLLWGRSVPATATHPVMHISEGSGMGWTFLPAQMGHKCPTVAQDTCVSLRRLILLGALPHHPKPGRMWAPGGHTFSPWLLCAGQEGLFKILSRYCVCSGSAVLWLLCCCCPKWLGWLSLLMELMFHLFRFLAEVFDLLGISHSTLQRFLLMFCFGTR